MNTEKIINQLGLAHLVKVINEKRKLLAGEVKTANIENAAVTADKLADDAVELKNLSDFLFPLNTTADLEDLCVQAGAFINAGEGWNTFMFHDAFEEVPLVIAQASGGYSVPINSVGIDRFVYKVLQSDDAPTAAPVEIKYVAIEYGGDA